MVDEKNVLDSLENYLNENWSNLRHKYPNVINIGVGRKVSEGQETGQLCLIFYVSKKVDAKLLAPRELIPKAIDDACTDVQSLQADFEVGETEPSKRPRSVQKRLAGGVIKK